MILKKGMTRIFLYAVEAFVLVISAFPLLWVIVSAFKTNGEILSDPLALPSSISLDTFAHLFDTYNFPVYFLKEPLI